MASPVSVDPLSSSTAAIASTDAVFSVIAPCPVAVDVGVIGVESLVAGESRTKGEVRFVTALHGLHIDRGQHFTKVCPVAVIGGNQVRQPLHGEFAEPGLLAFDAHTLRFLGKLLQGVLQSVSPLSE